MQWELSGSLALFEADVAALTAGPSAETLAELRGNFPLTSATLNALKRLARLNSLACNGAKATDDVLERLADFPRLSSLALASLDPEHVTKRGIAALARRPLTSLSLPSMKLDAETTRLFAAMPGLTELDLSGSNANDEAVAELAKHPSLVKLNLSRTAVTDASVNALKTMMTLRELELNSTAVTDDAAAKLGEALPKCRIWWADDKLLQPKSKDP
jgi:hypothetical protein